MVETTISGIQLVGRFGMIAPQAALEHLNVLKASITNDYVSCFGGNNIDSDAENVQHAIANSVINLREKLQNAPRNDDKAHDVEYALHVLDYLAPTQWSNDDTVKKQLGFVLQKLEACPDSRKDDFPELEAAKRYAHSTLSSINYEVTADNKVDIFNVLNAYSYTLHKIINRIPLAMLEYFWNEIAPSKYYADSELLDQLTAAHDATAEVLGDIKSEEKYTASEWHEAGVSLVEEIAKCTVRLAECPDYRVALRPVTAWCDKVVNEGIEMLNTYAQRNQLWAVSLLERMCNVKRYLHQNISASAYVNHISLTLDDTLELCGAYNNGAGVKVG